MARLSVWFERERNVDKSRLTLSEIRELQKLSMVELLLKLTGLDSPSLSLLR
jgi:hypothetical protein